MKSCIGWLLIAVVVMATGTAVAQTAASALSFASPNSVTAGGPGFTLSLFGVNFAAGATVLWNGSPLATGFVGPNQLSALVPANLITTAGSVTLTMQNPDGIRAIPISFTISQPPLAILTAVLAAGTAGSPYSTALSAAGGPAPYTWSVASGALPAGLALAANGTVSGTPTASGTFAFTVRVEDASHNAVLKSLQLSIGAPALSISNNSPLPAAVVGVAYSQTLIPSGGASPYRWAFGGTPPPGLTLGASTGLLAGTPSAPGTFNFTVQVTDNGGIGATKTLSLTVNAPPLTISTEALFNATVGVVYAQTFAASGGIPPYQWRITSGQTGGLAFDSQTASLTGTPQAAASSTTFSLQVTDSAGTTSAKTFTLVVEAPRLTILNSPQLPAGMDGLAYTQKFSGVGGAPPYSWTITSGAIPGLQLDSTTGVLSGTPSTAGTFIVTVQLRDGGGLTATKSFTVVINPSALLFTSSTQLTPAQLGVAYTENIAASGGVPPYSWSATGLPEGLELDAATGQISGVAKAPGTFTFAVRVTDSARSSAADLFRLAVTLPALPQVQLTGLEPIIDAAAQPRLELSLSSPYLVELSGQLTLSFAPDSGPGDPSIQFSTGGRTVAFRIAAGETRAQLPSELALQTGTVAGTLRITVQSRVGDTEIIPDAPPAFTARVERSAPRIKSAQLVRTGSGFNIQVTGFSTPREVTQVTFRFRAAPGNEVRTSEIQVPLEDLFSKWYQDSSSSLYGSQFTFSQPFTMLQGDANSLLLDSVTLSNRAGSTTLTLAR